ncbi:hypothetical protein [Jiangella gansuensis]|uniref:hypothetical protein n=1 Tax=Jiangella gansuensis TaxID=281473 RepID=UPI001FE0F8CE|nr:hypothetical protein [Jiangella gansuensis]
MLREKLAVLEGKITNLVAAIEGANAAPEVLLQQLSTRTHEGDMLRGELTRLTARQAIAADEVEQLIGLRRRAGVRTQRRDRRGEGRSLPGTAPPHACRHGP